MTAPPASRVARLRAEAAALLRIGGPLMAAQVAQMAMGFFDTVMMGRVGPVELAAVAIGTGLWHTLFLFALGGGWNWIQALGAVIVVLGVLVAQGLLPPRRP